MQLQQIKKRPRDPFPSPQAHLKKTKESLKGATGKGLFGSGAGRGTEWPQVRVHGVCDQKQRKTRPSLFPLS